MSRPDAGDYLPDDWLVAVNKPSGWLVHRSWLDRDEKVVVMQTVRDQIGQHVLPLIVSTGPPPACC